MDIDEKKSDIFKRLIFIGVNNFLFGFFNQHYDLIDFACTLRI